MTTTEEKLLELIPTIVIVDTTLKVAKITTKRMKGKKGKLRLI